MLYKLSREIVMKLYHPTGVDNCVASVCFWGGAWSKIGDSSGQNNIVWLALGIPVSGIESTADK